MIATMIESVYTKILLSPILQLRAYPREASLGKNLMWDMNDYCMKC